MESPPSCSTWSEAFILSDDSGLLLTSGSISSGSMSGDSRSGRCHIALEFQNSDCEDKSLSQADSLDDMSDIMCGENFNTLKKGPNWSEISCSKHTLAIEPPPEFQDKPLLLASDMFYNKNEIPPWLNELASQLVLTVIKDAMEVCCRLTLNRSSVLYKSFPLPKPIHITSRQYWTSDWMPFSPCHNAAARPSSRSSLGSARLSCSHNSLSIPSTCKADDSSFITQAVSHDTLTTNQISDLYNVPFDSDMYAVPVDVVKPPLRPKRNAQPRKRRRNMSSSFQNESLECSIHVRQSASKMKPPAHMIKSENVPGKRHSVPDSSLRQIDEPIHMTLQEVRQYLQTLYSNSSDSDHMEKHVKQKTKSDQQSSHKVTNNNKTISRENVNPGVPCKGNCANGTSTNNNNKNSKHRKHSFAISIKNKKVKDSYDIGKRHISSNNVEHEKNRRCPVRNFPSNLKQTICNLFRFRRYMPPENNKRHTKSSNSSGIADEDMMYDNDLLVTGEGEARKGGPLASRALPPLPAEVKTATQPHGDFATSIEKVKDYGWYWGPISSEAAEKILSNEPDGSFIVRDSSDDHYIFSLTFKLNSGVRHVRIEHDQGNFSFGSCTKFKSHTIIEFIENAVEHSRSGRYLFFLHRRPVLGPMRVQLLHPVSRFKQTQSLQHMCRFVILKLVRKDLIPSLPLPRRIIDYLSTPHYYSEQLLECDESNDSSNHESPMPATEDTMQS
ncbi:Suppressor of Cytokine Signaling at 16D [Carabus blaptoides fortunei]